MLREALNGGADGPQVSLSLGSTEAVKHAVEAGLGISVVLEGTAADEVRAGSLHALPLSDGALDKPLVVIERKDRPAGAPAARFARHLLTA